MSAECGEQTTKGTPCRATNLRLDNDGRFRCAAHLEARALEAELRKKRSALENDVQTRRYELDMLMRQIRDGVDKLERIRPAALLARAAELAESMPDASMALVEVAREIRLSSAWRST